MTARTGELKQGNEDVTPVAGHSGYGFQDRTIKKEHPGLFNLGSSSTVEHGQNREDKPGYGSNDSRAVDKVAGAGQLLLDNRDRTARTGHPGQNN
jgi:hypothetical protein